MFLLVQEERSFEIVVVLIGRQRFSKWSHHRTSNIYCCWQKIKREASGKRQIKVNAHVDEIVRIKRVKQASKRCAIAKEARQQQQSFLCVCTRGRALAQTTNCITST